MPPAVHDRHRHLHRPRARPVTHVQHQGAHDVTSIYEIVVPSPAGLPTLSLSDELSLSLSLSLSPTPLSLATVPTPSTTSTPYITPNHPQPSPLSLLYPQPIAPRHVGEYTMQQHHGARPLQRSLAHEEHHHTPPTPATQTPSMQTWLAVLVFIIVTITGWSVTVMAIHWRGATTGMVPPSYSEQQRSRRWARLQSFNSFARRGRERYEALRSDQGGDESGDDDFGTELRTATQASAHDVRLVSGNSTPSPAVLPTNPFLLSPGMTRGQPLERAVKPRGSAEWAEQHRAFFASHTSSVAQSSGSSTAHSLSGAELEDVESEAREAQGRRASQADIANGVRDRVANRSWVDLGLAAVDGVVDGVAAKIVRWTDDGGRDETLVLPLAKGKQD